MNELADVAKVTPSSEVRHWASFHAQLALAGESCIAV